MKYMKRLAALALALCIALSCVPALGDTLYREGDAGSDVMAIKERMKDLGYYTGNISHNRFNDIMTERVKQLQKMNGLAETGVIDDALYALIFSDAVIKKDGKPVNPAAAQPAAAAVQSITVQAAEPAQQTQAAPAAANDKVLYREGASGNDVMKIKERMFELGYYNTLPTVSSFNATMTERVKQLQESNGLEQTGVITQSLYDLLFSDQVKGPGGTIAGVLKQGDSGQKVGIIRKRLAELGYYENQGGNTFDATMTARIKVLQRLNGFEQTGEITPELYEYILSDKCTYCGESVNPMYNAGMRLFYELDGEKLYSLSSSGNIVIFIVDYFANNYLNNWVKSNLKTLGTFEDFTYYNNCDPRYIGTYPSITHMLTGNEYDPSLLVGEYFEQSWNSETCNYIFNTIHEKGYEFRYYYYTSISDGAMAWALGKVDNLVDVYTNPDHKITPIYSYTDFGDHLKQNGLQLDKTDKKYIQMIHLRGAHAPYSSDANGRYKADATRDENVVGYMSMVANYIQYMKALGVYDDSTIIITADHGDKANNMQVVYWIKQPGEHHDQWVENDAPISHDDFPGTILSLIGADYPYADSIFDWYPGETRQRTCGVVGQDLDLYPRVSCYSDLGMGSHNLWKTYVYEGDGQELTKQVKRNNFYYEPLAQSFN
ncbi:MAG: peptidoglycan-binding protein [Clostridia bacterium]|nr:peptidoglycan-binding protein [Clostridia bacterium]